MSNYRKVAFYEFSKNEWYYLSADKEAEELRDWRTSDEIDAAGVFESLEEALEAHNGEYGNPGGFATNRKGTFAKDAVLVDLVNGVRVKQGLSKKRLSLKTK